MAIIYISHRMAEIYELSDRVSVLRDGQYIGSLMRSELSASELVRMMVGRPLNDLFNKDRDIPKGKMVLECQELTDGNKVLSASLQVRAGEIIGLSGLVGSGRSELAQMIFGAEKRLSGSIRLNGNPLQINNPRDAIASGIGFLTENRKEQGLFLEMTVHDNIVMATIERDGKFGVLNEQRNRAISDTSIKALNIRVPHSQVAVGGLSGGNQQKCLISRWAAIHPKLLILDEPTRGVDVGAKVEIYNVIHELAERGFAIILISSEMVEVINLSHRVYVMSEGSITRELIGNEITEENIMKHAIPKRAARNIWNKLTSIK